MSRTLQVMIELEKAEVKRRKRRSRNQLLNTRNFRSKDRGTFQPKLGDGSRFAPHSGFLGSRSGTSNQHPGSPEAWQRRTCSWDPLEVARNFSLNISPSELLALLPAHSKKGFAPCFHHPSKLDYKQPFLSVWGRINMIGTLKR